MNPFLIFELTTKCTHKCTYCYNVWLEKEDYPRGHMPFSKIKELFDDLLDQIHLSGIALAGGEPLLHPEIIDIVDYFSKKNIPVGVATNGVLLNPKMIDKLSEKGANYFEVSIDTLRDEEYVDLTGNKKLANIKENILYLKKKNIKTTIASIISKQNLNEIEEVIDLAFGFGINTVALNRFVPGGDGLKNLESLAITHAELEKVLQAADVKAKQLKVSVNATIPVEPCEIDHQQFEKINFGTCVCGKHKWVVDPFGNLRTCEQNSDILGSLFQHTFDELANSQKAIDFRCQYQKPECNGCAMFSSCGGGCRFVYKQ
jgi:AdoMet-dependent heme synthase